MTLGADRLRSSRLRTATLRSTSPAGADSVDDFHSRSQEDFHSRSQETMRTAAIRAEGIWAEGEMRAIDAEVRPAEWGRPSDGTVVLDALLTATEIPVRAWRPRQVAFAALETDAVDRARRLGTVGHPLRDVIARTAQDAIGTVQAFAEGHRRGGAEGNAVITEWSADRYGAPTAETLDHAHALINEPWRPPAPGSSLTAAEAAGFLQRALDVLAPGWDVRTSPLSTAVLVDGLNNTVEVNRHLRIGRAQLARLLVHELGGHVLRWANAGAFPGSLATVPLGSDAHGTEEGLATWWEHHLGVGDPAALRIYAARTVAVSVALRGSIHDVVAALAPHLPLHDAARIAMRVKRGLPDPTAPGAFTRDHAFLAGFDVIRGHLDRSPAGVADLMSTRWGLSMLPALDVVRAAGLLTGTPRLPDRETLVAPLVSVTGAGPR